MSFADGPLHEMERHLGRPDRTDPLTLDDGTAERLLRGSLSADDAPRGYQRVTAVLAALTPPPSATERSGDGEAVEAISRRIAAATSSPSRSRSTKMNMKRRIQIAGVSLVGSATLLSGFGAAGALPGAAQGIASDMLSTVGVSVPNPNPHSDGHPDQRGRSGDAVNTADTGADTGSTVSGVAKDPSTTGIDKGAAVSSVASDGQSRAGEVTPPAGPPADPTASAPVATPNPGGTGTADGASGGQSDPGTGTAGDVSGGRSTAGSGNAGDGLTHKP